MPYPETAVPLPTTTATIAAMEFKQRSGEWAIHRALGTKFENGMQPPTISSMHMGTGHASSGQTIFFSVFVFSVDSHFWSTSG